MTNETYFDETLERHIIWLAMCGTANQKKTIYRTVRPEMVCVHCEGIFKVAAGLFMQGNAFGLPEVSARLKDKGEELPVHYLDASDFDFGEPLPMIERLTGLWQKRELSKRLETAALRLKREPALDVGRYLAAAVMQTIGTAASEEEPTVEDLVSEALIRYNSGERKGYATGITPIDNWCGGLVAGRLYVLGATKKTGKTRMAVAAMYGVAMNGVQCTLITLEMAPSEIVDLLNAKMCGINSGRIENRTLTNEDNVKIADNTTALVEILGRLHLVAPAMLTPEGLEALIRFQVSLYRVKVVAIDFLTKIIIDTRFENAERGKICARLSALARELNIAILLIVQLNKTAETVEHPNISMIEGSGQITQFADVIMILVNETRTKNNAPVQTNEQRIKMHITQRQNACSSWIPMIGKLQILKFEEVN